MSDPIFGRRDVSPLKQLQNSVAGKGWDGLQLENLVGAQPVPYQPHDEVLKHLAQMAGYAEGLAVIEWLMDITIRMPDKTGALTIEKTAMNAVARQARANVGEVILVAIAEGDKLLKG